MVFIYLSDRKTPTTLQLSDRLQKSEIKCYSFVYTLLKCDEYGVDTRRFERTIN